MNLPNVSSRFGAPMGRRNLLPDDIACTCRLHLVRLRWVDNDYDQGGAYWGGPTAGTPYSAIYWAYDEAVQIFVRSGSRQDAKDAVRKSLPNAKFYR